MIIQAMEGSTARSASSGSPTRRKRATRSRRSRSTAASGCVDADAGTIADGSYPLSRSLYIYVNKAKVASNPALAAFVDLYLSDEGIVSGPAGRLRRPARPTSDATRATWEAASA